MSASFPPRREVIYSIPCCIYIYISLLRKLVVLTQFPSIDLFPTLLIIIFTTTIIKILSFNIIIIIIIINTPNCLAIFIKIIINKLYASLLLSKSVLDFYIFHICDNSVYITIWYWTIFYNYKKNFFKKNFKIYRILYLKFIFHFYQLIDIQHYPF